VLTKTNVFFFKVNTFACLHDWMDILRVKVAASVGEKMMMCRGSCEMKAENSDKFGSLFSRSKGHGC
jgi:hypothetical protein